MLKMAKMMNVPVIGFVENYSFLECPDCGKKIKVFGESHLDKVAAQLDIPVLARLPINPAIAQAYDGGRMESVDTSCVSGVIEAIRSST